MTFRFLIKFNRALTNYHQMFPKHTKVVYDKARWNEATYVGGRRVGIERLNTPIKYKMDWISVEVKSTARKLEIDTQDIHDSLLACKVVFLLSPPHAPPLLQISRHAYKISFGKLEE
ncbi:hypothetical protein ACTXT7_003968 [Hymenolepis weldensis]